MSNSSPKSYSLLAAVLIIGCIVAGYLVLANYWPAYTFAKDRKANAEADNMRLKKAIEASEAFLETYQEQSENAAMLKLALPVENYDMANFVNSFSQLAQQSGVALLNLQVTNQSSAAVIPEHSIRPVNMTVNVTGTYAAFSDFMKNLEKHLRIVDVHHISFIGVGDAGSGTPTLQYSLQMRTYYQQ